MVKVDNPIRRRFSWRLVRAARDPGLKPDMSVAELVFELGDRSFGWCIVIFTLFNMLPMPIGSTMILAIPVIMVTAQLAAGMPLVWLPGFVMKRRFSRKRFQRLVLKLGPVIRPVERLAKQRHHYMFTSRAERALGVMLCLVAMALFVPIPFSAYLPATALLLAGIGLVERDGLIVWWGVGLGIVAIVVTLVVGILLLTGAEALVGVASVSPLITARVI